MRRAIEPSASEDGARGRRAQMRTCVVGQAPRSRAGFSLSYALL